MTDIFAIQDEITQAIATALRMKLSPETAALRRHTPNLRAYEVYLKSRDHWFKPSPESLARVKEFLDHAIAARSEVRAARTACWGCTTRCSPTLASGRHARSSRWRARAVQRRCASSPPCLKPTPSWRVGGGTTTTNGARRNGMASWRWRANLFPRRSFLVRQSLPVADRALRRCRGSDEVGLERDPLNPLVPPPSCRRSSETPAGSRTRKPNCDRSWSSTRTSRLALDTLGAVCAQQGRFEEALALSERAYALTPWASPTVGQLAALLVRAGATSRAERVDREAQAGHERVRSARRAWQCFTRCVANSIGPRNGPSARSKSGIRYSSRSCGPLLGSTPGWPALARKMNLP